MKCPKCGSIKTRDSYGKACAEFTGQALTKLISIPVGGYFGAAIGKQLGMAGKKLGGAIYNKRVCERCGHSWFYDVDLWGGKSDESPSPQSKVADNRQLVLNKPLDQLKKSASNGDIDAMLQLAIIYSKEGSNDWKKYWWNKAKNSGYSGSWEGAVNKFTTTENNSIQKAMDQSVIDQLKSKAQKGDTIAMVALGDKLYSERPDWAYYWYDRASKAGNQEGRSRLSRMRR